MPRAPRAALSCVLLAAVLLNAGCMAVGPAPPADSFVGPARPADTERRPLPGDGPLVLTTEEAALLALQNNQSFRVDRLNPPIQSTSETQERARYDPTLAARLSGSRQRFEQEREFFGGREDVTQIDTNAEASLTQFLPGGTGVGLDFSASRVFSNADDGQEDEHTTRVGLTVTQALLRGYGTKANLARIRQARIDTRVSEYELRSAAEQLVASAESTFWDYVLARRRIEIFTESLELAQQQLRETEERIRLGRVARSELAAARAEVARRREELINARSEMETTRLRLLRLVNPGVPEQWERKVEPLGEPEAPDTELGPVSEHVELALRMRPDLNQARLQVKRGDLEVVRTENGMLPRLNIFVQAGKSGIGDRFGHSLGDMENDAYDVLGGLDYQFPPYNREARARHRRAVLTRAQAVEAVRNLEQVVQVDVRSAYIEVDRAREQVAATAATRRFRQESLDAETEKFRVGKSTSFLVAQAQRDLVESEIAEVEARVNYLKALIELYRLEGSLLERRGIRAPGTERAILR